MIRIFGTGLVNKVELKQAGDREYVKIRIGSPDRGKVDGQWTTVWTNVDAMVWRGAKFLAEKLGEGDRVDFCGQPSIETWEGRDNKTRITVVIPQADVTPVGEMTGTGASGGGGDYEPPAGGGGGGGFKDDDLPFMRLDERCY